MPRWPALLVIAACGCAPAAAPVAPPPAPAPAARPPLEVHWYRNSAEQRAIYLQTYRWAAERLRENARSVTGDWGVILDADETVLDNSAEQLRQVRSGVPFNTDLWNAWVRQRAATALPGAVDFVSAVRSMGGRVVIVTNRDQVVCDDTRANLAAVGIAADAVLCKGQTSDKNPRFRAVEAGTAAPGLPAMRVLMWVGDNIQDFPGMTQAARGGPAGALDAFGRTFVVLPNPMYGSWERTPLQ